MKLAVIGLGAIARFVLDAAAEDEHIDVVAVCDRDEARLADWAHLPAFTDHRHLLDAALAEAVVVTLPNDAHAEVARDALARGVAVCCEKPLAVTVADAERMAAAARDGGAVLFTAFHRRYNRNLLDLAARLPADRSRIASVTARYHENITEHTGGERWYLDPVRCGGGCVIDNGPNALDAVRFLLGGLTLVDATLGDVRSGAEFCAELDLRSADGVPVRVELDWALPTGEVKDIEVRLTDGTVLSADLLGGFTGFKASLRHEYRGVLTAFRHAVDEGPRYRDPGPDLVGLVAEAYRVGRAKENRLRMTAKDPADARLVSLLWHARDDRGMTLSPWRSRCVQAGQVHELVTTTDRPTREGDRIDAVGFLGFVEFRTATVLRRGDEVWQGGTRRIGTVAGFDECHFPNHYNVLIDVDALVTAADLDLGVEDTITFREPAGCDRDH